MAMFVSLNQLVDVFARVTGLTSSSSTIFPVYWTTQRDLPNWGLPAKPQRTDRLLRMLAALHGQVWNASQVGQSMGLSYQTVNSYLDYLAGAFLIRRLQPYQANVRKRLVKTPRIYWRDSGLLHALLNV